MKKNEHRDAATSIFQIGRDWLRAAIAIGLTLAVASCASHVRPLDEQAIKSIQSARVIIVGGKMNDMSNIARRSGPLRANTPQEVEATRVGLQSGIDAADVAGLLRSNAMKHAGLAAPIALSFDPPGSGGTSPFEGYQLRIEFTAGVRDPGGIIPDVYPYLHVVARVLAPGGEGIRYNKWTYCGDTLDFTEVVANRGAKITAELQRAAILIGEAIMYDTFAAPTARLSGGSGIRATCMSFDDLPSRPR